MTLLESGAVVSGYHLVISVSPHSTVDARERHASCSLRAIGCCQSAGKCPTVLASIHLDSFPAISSKASTTVSSSALRTTIFPFLVDLSGSRPCSSGRVTAPTEIRTCRGAEEVEGSVDSHTTDKSAEVGAESLISVATASSSSSE